MSGYRMGASRACAVNRPANSRSASGAKPAEPVSFLSWPPVTSRIQCPKGWMSPKGYTRYLKTTLEKMHQRIASRRRSKKNGGK